MNRFIVLAALVLFAAIVTGAYDTSSHIAAGPSGAVVDSLLHRALAIAATVLTLAAAIRSRNGLGWAAFAALAASAAIGWMHLTPLLIVVHALLAHTALGCLAALTLLTSGAWSRGAERLVSSDAAMLRSLATATPAAVLCQIALGALYRHQIFGIMPHMGGAMLVALMTLVLSALVLQNYPKHRELKSAAVGMMSVILAQVSLGVAVFVMLLVEAANTPVFAWIATGHVAIGALALSASVVMAFQVRRYLEAPSADAR